jgi:hypothetical protein
VHSKFTKAVDYKKKFNESALNETERKQRKNFIADADAGGKIEQLIGLKAY